MRRRLARSLAVLALGVLASAAACSSQRSVDDAAESSSLPPDGGTGSVVAASSTAAAATTPESSADPQSAVTDAPVQAPPPTGAPAPKPAPTSPPATPTTPAPTEPPGPKVSNVRYIGPYSGVACVIGEVPMIRIAWSALDAAGVMIFSTTYGNLGQFPAEDGGADVPFDCTGDSTVYTLTPVGSGGGNGPSVELTVDYFPI
jgi:hypothetical protein